MASDEFALFAKLHSVSDPPRGGGAGACGRYYAERHMTGPRRWCGRCCLCHANLTNTNLWSKKVEGAIAGSALRTLCGRSWKAIEMDSDHMFHLNFAITLFNHGDLTEAGEM